MKKRPGEYDPGVQAALRFKPLALTVKAKLREIQERVRKRGPAVLAVGLLLSHLSCSSPRDDCPEGCVEQGDGATTWCVPEERDDSLGAPNCHDF